MTCDLKALQNPDICHFIREHINSDVTKLALKKPPRPDWPYTEILNQIKARQKAQKKLPSWANNFDLILPHPDVIEQASSEATATYKSTLLRGKNLIDLTGGSGIDSVALAQNFEHITIIEQDTYTSAVLKHNMEIFLQNKNTVIVGKSEDNIEVINKNNFIYIDPQRRDLQRKGYIKLEDYKPNILEILPQITNKTEGLLIKTSPMLDLWQAVEDLKFVHEIHIVEWQNDCKEVLYLLNFKNTISANDIFLQAVQINDDGKAVSKITFTRQQEENMTDEISAPKTYLYEPGPALLKSGAFRMIARTYNITKLHKHTHLYTSDEKIENFPGRIFKIQNITAANRKEIPYEKANLTTRNFPETVEKLRKKLKIKDGGDIYLFACTLCNEQKAMLHTKKA